MAPSVNDQTNAMAYGLAAVICWSTVATAFKLSLQHLTPIQLLLIASAVSASFLIAVLVVQNRLSEIWTQSAHSYKQSFLFGLLNPTLYYLLLFWAYELLPAQEAQTINYSWAIVMSLLAVPLLGHKLRWFDIIAAALCYFGVCIIATRGNLTSLDFVNLDGVILAVLSTFVWSFYWIFCQKDRREPILALCLNFLCTLPIIIVIAFLSGELVLINWRGIAGGAYVGLLEMGLAFLLWLSAMKLTQNTARVANLIFISPFLSLFFISFFLGEAILISTIAGLILIVSGLILQQQLSKTN